MQRTGQGVLNLPEYMLSLLELGSCFSSFVFPVMLCRLTSGFVCSAYPNNLHHWRLQAWTKNEVIRLCRKWNISWGESYWKLLKVEFNYWEKCHVWMIKQWSYSIAMSESIIYSIHFLGLYWRSILLALHNSMCVYITCFCMKRLHYSILDFVLDDNNFHQITN